jgi:hypothetical protein
VRILVKVIFAAILAWATYAVTETGVHSRGLALKVAGGAIAISAALQFVAAADDWLASNTTPVKRRVDRVLLNRLSALYRTGTLVGNPANISVHVWEVPFFFRRVFPYGLRKRLRAIFPKSVQKLAWRPRLVRIGEGGMRRLPPSGVSFRKGNGLIGIALQDNEHDSVYWVDFEDDDLKDALEGGQTHWKGMPEELTQNLRYLAARRLARRYSEALALVIQDADSGEALGCLTLEAEVGASADLRNNEDLHAELRSTADLLSPVLARSK